MLDRTKYLTIKKDTLDDIDKYVRNRIPPGGFLSAVLSNNLQGSFSTADQKNRETLFDICRYIYNETPSVCHGSPSKVLDWLNEDEKSIHSIVSQMNEEFEKRSIDQSK